MPFMHSLSNPQEFISEQLLFLPKPFQLLPLSFIYSLPSSQAGFLQQLRQEVPSKRIKYNKKQMISLGSGFDFSCNWQLAYEQLLVLYSQMNADYQRAQETGVILTEKVETITKENEEIRSKKMIKTFQTIPNPIVPSFTEISHLEPEITIKVPKKSPQLPKTSEKIRRLNSIQTSEGNFYECSYQGCGRVYQSSVSLNLHIKIKHNGGTKKEREEYAKMVIDAEERGDKAPHVPIEFPPNFLQEFRTTYSYMKKYSM